MAGLFKSTGFDSAGNNARVLCIAVFEAGEKIKITDEESRTDTLVKGKAGCWRWRVDHTA
jgi:hypothetical protein